MSIPVWHFDPDEGMQALHKRACAAIGREYRWFSNQAALLDALHARSPIDEVCLLIRSSALTATTVSMLEREYWPAVKIVTMSHDGEGKVQERHISSGSAFIPMHRCEDQAEYSEFLRGVLESISM
jgi:hypothetical protein